MPCFAGSKRWTFVRPWRFPAYSAASAWWMIWCRSALGSGKAEIPIVTENAYDYVSRGKQQGEA